MTAVMGPPSGMTWELLQQNLVESLAAQQLEHQNCIERMLTSHMQSLLNALDKRRSIESLDLDVEAGPSTILHAGPKSNVKCDGLMQHAAWPSNAAVSKPDPKLAGSLDSVSEEPSPPDDNRTSQSSSGLPSIPSKDAADGEQQDFSMRRVPSEDLVEDASDPFLHSRNVSKALEGNNFRGLGS